MKYNDDIQRGIQTKGVWIHGSIVEPLAASP